jgi:hypothetical protein
VQDLDHFARECRVRDDSRVQQRRLVFEDLAKVHYELLRIVADFQVIGITAFAGLRSVRIHFFGAAAPGGRI